MISNNVLHHHRAGAACLEVAEIANGNMDRI